MSLFKLLSVLTMEGAYMLFYVDYLDHITSGNAVVPFEYLAIQLRFDLLLFSKDTLCMSVPACIKREETANLLMQLDDFWENGIIKLQLDEKHKGNPNNYFSKRKSILENNLSEENLLSHFEYAAYTSNRKDAFFNIYLPSTNSNKDIFIGKDKDTDLLFRESTASLFNTYFDSLCGLFDPSRRINFTGIVREIVASANYKDALFQRAILEDNIQEEFSPSSEESSIVSSILDRAFAKANADTSAAVSISLIMNQLNGKRLIKLLKVNYPYLYKKICAMTWRDVYYLSQDKDWRSFISYINVFIYVIQNMLKSREGIPIDDVIKKFAHINSLYSTLSILKNEAISSFNSFALENAALSSAVDIERAIETLYDCYSGKYRLLFDTMAAIGIFEEIIEKRILAYDKYSKLDVLAEQQQNKNYVIRM